MTKALKLYRQILRAHRQLPREIRFVGDQYVRAEFRNHRTVTDKRFLEPFFKQWTIYLENIRDNEASWDVGRHLDRETVESLDDDRAEQLLDLHRASFGTDSSTKDGNASTATPPRRK
ncbi:hypothetical protein EV175_005915 [Coemansia sp. RSA 1933]|nr:hypothetical protein EV175_005915 [Coemansia sp. RSA 1933]